MRDHFREFETKRVTIVGVSFDTPQDNATFRQQQQFPFLLLSDTTRTLAVAVGAADSPTQPVARRISYLVGADGTVLKAYADVVPASHAQQVLADLGDSDG